MTYPEIGVIPFGKNMLHGLVFNAGVNSNEFNIHLK